MRRLRGMLRRSGTILIVLGLALAAIVGAASRSSSAGIAVALTVAMVATVVHHDQLVRRLYRISRQQAGLLTAHEASALQREATRLTLDHISARLDLSALQLREISDAQQELSEAHQSLHRSQQRTDDELPALRQLVVDECSAVTAALRSATDHLDGRAESAEQHSQSLVDGLRRAEHSANTLSREVYQRLDSAHWHRERLYRQVEAMANLSDLWDGGSGFPPFRDWALSPDVAVMLSRILAQGNRQFVVELGSGSSTALMSRIMAQNGGGRLVAIDHDAKFIAATESLVAELGEPDLVELRLCELTQVEIGGEQRPWYDLEPSTLDHPIDLLFVDGPPGDTGALARLPAQLLFDRMSVGGLIVLDDASRKDEQRTVELWSERPDIVVDQPPPTEKGVAILRKIDIDS